MQERHSLGELEEKLGYCFKDKALLRQAVTHSSYANEQKINRHADYERLEFLGDAVLETITSIYIYETYPKLSEGEMTRKRATIVCGSALAFCARDLELGKYILLGKGEEATGGREKENITSDVVEAIIGAIFLDGGYEGAKEFIHRIVLSDLESKELFFDSKSLLQEHVQRKCGSTLSYAVLTETGPDHEKEFVVEVQVNGKAMGRGSGKTKKLAEQRAAYEALLALRAST